MIDAPEPSTEKKLSEEEAGSMLANFLSEAQPGEPEVKKAAEEKPVAGKKAASEANYAPEETGETPPDETKQAELVAEDDVASLKERHAKEIETFSKRLADVQERSRQSVEIVRSRMLAKSTQLDRARQLLDKALHSEQGVDKTEVERLMAEIQSGLNPQSTNFQPAAAPPNDDAVLGINEFLNENGISGDDAAAFGQWARGPSHTLTPRDLQLAERDAYAFMYAAWPKFAKSKELAAANPEPSVTVRAIKTVQKVQRAAARAASNAPSEAGGADKTKQEPPDPRKLTDSQLAAMMQALGGFR